MDHPYMEHPHEHGELDPNGKYDIPVPAEPLRATTAFLVVIHPDGTAAAYSDVNMPVVLEREPTLNEMYAGSAQVMKDVQTMQMTQNVVQQVVNAMMQVAQQQMMAAQNQQIANKVMAPNRNQRRHG